MSLHWSKFCQFLGFCCQSFGYHTSAGLTCASVLGLIGPCDIAIWVMFGSENSSARKWRSCFPYEPARDHSGADSRLYLFDRLILNRGKIQVVLDCING